MGVGEHTTGCGLEVGDGEVAGLGSPDQVDATLDGWQVRIELDGEGLLDADDPGRRRICGDETASREADASDRP